MSAVFDKPSLLQRILPLFRGFDGILVLLCLLLAGAGLLARIAPAPVWAWPRPSGRIGLNRRGYNARRNLIESSAA